MARRVTRSWYRTATLIGVLALIGVVVPAGAASSTESAAAVPGTYDVKTCYASYGWGRQVLRYGNRRFGYRHIKARRGWTAKVRRLIRTTLLSYSTYELAGDRLIFRRYRRSVVSVVVVSRKQVPRARGRGRVGILTAYRKRRGGDSRRGSLPPLSPGVDPNAC